MRDDKNTIDIFFDNSDFFMTQFSKYIYEKYDIYIDFISYGRNVDKEYGKTVIIEYKLESHISSLRLQKILTFLFGNILHNNLITIKENKFHLYFELLRNDLFIFKRVVKLDKVGVSDW